MSYTALIKDEIVHATFDPKFYFFELYPYLKKMPKDKFEIVVDNIGIARRIYTILKELDFLAVKILYLSSNRFKLHKTCVITISLSSVDKEIEFKKFILHVTNLKKDELLKSVKGFYSYLRGMFLAYGYVQNPVKGYALDFLLDDSEDAAILASVLKKRGIKAHLKQKKSKYLVFIRNYQDIKRVIVDIGALNAFFEYENSKIFREVKRDTIRSMNWEISNESKSLATATKQLEMINFFKESKIFLELSAVLKEAIEIRVLNPEASLSELASILGITKSGLRNRFNRLENIYNKELIEK